MAYLISRYTKSYSLLINKGHNVNQPLALTKEVLINLWHIIKEHESLLVINIIELLTYLKILSLKSYIL